MAHKGPDFIGIGMQKSGTTFLYDMLKRTPGVRFPAHPGSREWLENPLVDGRRLNTLPKEIQFLAGPNAGWSWQRYLEIFSDAPPGVVQGEISPAYADSTLDRIKALRDHCPDVRLFAVLRDPISRDWSAIRMIAARLGQLEDPEALARIAVSEHVRAMGNYASQLQAWLSVFPRESFLFLTNEALDAAPKASLPLLLKHIGADQTEVPDLPSARVFPGPKATLPPDVGDLLRERHADTASQVAELTGLDVSGWARQDEAA